MIRHIERETVLYLPDGLSFRAGPDGWTVPPLNLRQASWTALIPAGVEPVVDPAVNLSRIIATMSEPLMGTVELLDKNVYRLEYGERQRMRARIGFVHGYGGLLSNRSIRGNIALPVSVHGKMPLEEEAALISHIMRTFGLEKVEHMKPHEVDGGTRWNVCLARAMALRPRWLVLEGIGNWEMDRGQSTAWKALMDRRHTSRMATAICLPRQNPGFEAWFEKHGGMLVRYPRMAEAPVVRRKA
jgi:ABC-type transport system involved in cytochrome c biogenesis ATPase subunit